MLATLVDVADLVRLLQQFTLLGSIVFVFAGILNVVIALDHLYCLRYAKNKIINIVLFSLGRY